MKLNGHYEGVGGISVTLIAQSRSPEVNSAMMALRPATKAFLDNEARRIQEIVSEILKAEAQRVVEALALLYGTEAPDDRKDGVVPTAQ